MSRLVLSTISEYFGIVAIKSLAKAGLSEISSRIAGSRNISVALRADSFRLGGFLFSFAILAPFSETRGR
jgi:hypothetical protein